jgi:hypothetical protein
VKKDDTASCTVTFTKLHTCIGMTEERQTLEAHELSESVKEILKDFPKGHTAVDAFGCTGGLGPDPSDSPGPFTCNKCSKDTTPEVSVFKTVKCSLKSVVKDDISIKKLQDAASRSSQIMTHGLHLLKLYLIHCFDNDLPLPRLDRKFVHSAMMVCCGSTGRGARLGEAAAEIRNTLTGFAEEHYPVEKVSAYHLKTVLDYMADDVVTMYERNIQQQYEGYLQRYVDILTGE